MTISKFNAFDYFDTDAQMLDYLQMCYHNDDPQLFVLALSHLIEKKGVSKVAELITLHRESLCQATKEQTSSN